MFCGGCCGCTLVHGFGRSIPDSPALLGWPWLAQTWFVAENDPILVAFLSMVALTMVSTWRLLWLGCVGVLVLWFWGLGLHSCP